MAATLGIYYLTPWLRWDRGPNLPDQAVLIDLAHRRFYFFMIEIWPHEFYFVAGLLIMAGIGLFLFTAALGRVWCGYTCPQTVWTDLFILVERWIEGDRNARVRLWKAKWDARKVRLRLTKWVVWLGIAVATGGAWVFYFADAPTLLRDLVTGQALTVAYASVAVLTATTFVLGGLMREQVCIYMCPWPRIQAAMMDENSLVVSYRDWRGEPRGKHRKAEGAEALGDCIDCSACVNVCPTGVDIREGQQLACITCALCIDACDDIMDKVGKPRGLIGYVTLNDLEREVENKEHLPAWKQVIRPRILVYFALWAAIGVGLVVALFLRSDIEMNVSPVRNPVFVTLSDGSVRNAYEVRMRNMSTEGRNFRLFVESEAGLRIELQGQADLHVEIAPDATFSQRVFLIAAPESAAAAGGQVPVWFWMEDTTSESRMRVGSHFTGAGQ